LKLITYHSAGADHVGIVRDDQVIALSDIAPALPDSMKALAAIKDPVAKITAALDSNPSVATTPLSSVKLRPVVTDPGKIICVGLNYADHAAEGGHEIPTYPALFMRGANSLAAADEPIISPHCSDKLDYEAELMIIIGQGGRHITQTDALDAVFAYTVFNDGSIRDYQRKSAQWTAGKNFDQTGPVGPWAMTPEDLPAGASGLKIESRLNGEVMQSSNTEHLIFSVARIIEIVSEYSTLAPGDLIATGTPGGVGWPRTPPVFMKTGDTIEIEIEKLGLLTSKIADET
jgi:2-keto-4-pentenoate hydratase/2-oxohepta-3-ene-1,7-dioic acid hydratase in catechol pathway